MSAQTSTTTSGVGKAIVSRVAQVGVDDITSKDELLSHLLGEVQQLGRKAMVLPHDASNEIWDKEEVEQAAANLEGPEVVSVSSQCLCSRS
jgi:NAD(P)-dependent dehydrogenase (short-subunit alcohol dehydrogenase family)